MTRHSRQIYQQIMLPMIRRGAMQAVHVPHLNRIIYRAFITNGRFDTGLL